MNILFLIDRFGPGVGHLNYLAVWQGVGIFEFFFRARDYKSFPGLGNFSYI